MSPILTNVIASKTASHLNNSVNLNREGGQQNVPSKSMGTNWSEDSDPIRMEYIEFDEDDGRQRFGSGKRAPSPDAFSNQSETAKRIRLVNLTDSSRLSENNGRVPTGNGNKSNVLDDVSPLIESQYIVDDGEQVVYINDGQMSRTSDMTGIENETVEALMQSLSPYEFSFNEMGQLMITEPIFANEDTTTNAATCIQPANIIAATDDIAVQQLSECNITTEDLDDIDQLVAPILENSEGKPFSCNKRHRAPCIIV